MRSSNTENEQKVRLWAQLSGRVQGVGFRYYAQRQAKHFGVVGYVRNLPRGDVLVEAEGDREALDLFLRALQKGPPLAHVAKVEVDWLTPTNAYTSFDIR